MKKNSCLLSLMVVLCVALSGCVTGSGEIQYMGALSGELTSELLVDTPLRLYSSLDGLNQSYNLVLREDGTMRCNYVAYTDWRIGDDNTLVFYRTPEDTLVFKYDPGFEGLVANKRRLDEPEKFWIRAEE